MQYLGAGSEDNARPSHGLLLKLEAFDHQLGTIEFGNRRTTVSGIDALDGGQNLDLCILNEELELSFLHRMSLMLAKGDKK
jgi:hypothetical protein